MKVGEYWVHLLDNPTIKILKYLGNDTWDCLDMDCGDGCEIEGSWIYKHFKLVEDPIKLEKLDMDWDEYDRMIRKIFNSN